jgi:hypothetical protein
MTCKGYDPKAVKLGSLVKMAASTIVDRHQRGAFLRSFTKIAEDEARQRGSRNRKEKE